MVRTRQTSSSIPFYRNVRVLTVLAQIGFALAVLGLGWLLLSTMLVNLERQGIPISFAFLRQPAGFGISEGLPFDPSQSYLAAFGVGVVNTIRVAVAGIVLATVLGLGLGVARLSRNWLLARLATAYVEVFRNVPLLLWLVFAYAALRVSLPRLRQSLTLLGDAVLMSNRGVALPWPRASATFPAFVPWGIAAVILGLATWVWLQRRSAAAAGRAAGFGRACLVALVVCVAGFVATGAAPIYWSVPRVSGFRYQGGVVLTPEFTALLLGLVIYTAAFIAEVVRAGMLAVPKGQQEAAQALGLSSAQTFRYVMFPQALRVIIPPLINQYLNLTKNSSLAIAVGYPDLFSVGLTINNQTGQAIPFVLMIMVVYLSMSLLTSAALNLVNRRLALKS